MGSNETRQRILEAAASEFAEKGFAGATTRAIATRAGVNEVTLFRHFGNKQDLFAAVVRDVPATQPMIEKALTRLKEMAPRDALYEMGMRQVTGLEQHLPWLRLQMLEPSSSPQALQIPGFRFRTSLADYLRLWQQRGTLRADVDPDLAAEAFAVAIFGFILANRVVFPTDSAPSAEAFVRAQVDIFLSGMEARA